MLHYILTQHTYVVQVFQVTGFGFVNKPSSNLFLYQKSYSEKLSLPLGFGFNSFAIYVIELQKQMYKIQ